MFSPFSHFPSLLFPLFSLRTSFPFYLFFPYSLFFLFLAVHFHYSSLSFLPFSFSSMHYILIFILSASFPSLPLPCCTFSFFYSSFFLVFFPSPSLHYILIIILSPSFPSLSLPCTIFSSFFSLILPYASSSSLQYIHLLLLSFPPLILPYHFSLNHNLPLSPM